LSALTAEFLIGIQTKSQGQGDHAFCVEAAPTPAQTGGGGLWIGCHRGVIGVKTGEQPAGVIQQESRGNVFKLNLVFQDCDRVRSEIRVT